MCHLNLDSPDVADRWWWAEWGSAIRRLTVIGHRGMATTERVQTVPTAEQVG